MLRAGIFEELKGARTLLLWGDEAGMRQLSDVLSALRRGEPKELLLDGCETRLTLSVAAGPWWWSRLRKGNDGLHWECSAEMIETAQDYVAPLIGKAGHQYLDTSGLAEQVVISSGEYPTDMSEAGAGSGH